MSQTPKIFDPWSWTYASWKRFFFVAALWNFLGAAPSIIMPRFNLRLFYDVTQADPVMVFLNRGLWWAVLIFGIGYLFIASDPGRNIGIVIMGIIGKTVVALHWFAFFAFNHTTYLAALAAAGDSLFTVFFVIYLWQGPRSADVDPNW